jgi:hypothetical protein
VSDFEDIVNASEDPTGFVAAVREATAEMLREQPDGVTPEAIGHRAWKQLTPVQQAHALGLLFNAFVLQLHEEDQADRLARESAAVTTYLQAEEEIELHRALGEVRPLGDNTLVTVNAVDLSNVLDELTLVRHRLAMAKSAPERP